MRDSCDILKNPAFREAMFFAARETPKRFPTHERTQLALTLGIVAAGRPHESMARRPLRVENHVEVAAHHRDGVAHPAARERRQYRDLQCRHRDTLDAVP